MIDIDDFKAINGSHGHLVGDDVFGTLGTTIGHSIRKMDRPARYGGEELTVIIPKAGLAHAAERIRQSIEGLLFQGFRVTVSIGVGQTNRHIGTAKALIESADAALDQAKRQGKNGMVIAEQNTGSPRKRRAYDPSQESRGCQIKNQPCTEAQGCRKKSAGKSHPQP